MDVLKALWAIGSGSVREVHGRMCPGGELAFNTVQTLLRIMEEKGLVRHRARGPPGALARRGPGAVLVADRHAMVIRDSPAARDGPAARLGSRPDRGASWDQSGSSPARTRDRQAPGPSGDARQDRMGGGPIA